MKFVCFFIPFAENNSDMLDYDRYFTGLDYLHNLQVIMVMVVLSFSLCLDSSSGSRIPHR